jgi:hypothetical protein
VVAGKSSKNAAVPLSINFLNYGANQAAQRIARAVGFWTRWGNLTINHKSLDKLLMLLHILD